MTNPFPLTPYVGVSSSWRPRIRHARYACRAWFVELHLFHLYVGIGR